VNDRREARVRSVAILDPNYRIECSSGFGLNDRLPKEIENKVRELMTSWQANQWNAPERHCVLSPGLLMRVFLLLGTETYRVAVSLESHDERAGGCVKGRP
jgi:hypothetical protein